MTHARFAGHRMKKRLRHRTHVIPTDATTHRIDGIDCIPQKQHANTDTTYEI